MTWLYTGNNFRINGPEVSAGNCENTMGVAMKAKKTIPPKTVARETIPAVFIIFNVSMIDLNLGLI